MEEITRCEWFEELVKEWETAETMKRVAWRKVRKYADDKAAEGMKSTNIVNCPVYASLADHYDELRVHADGLRRKVEFYSNVRKALADLY